METKSLAVTGSPVHVGLLLLAAQAAPRIARMAASDDGESVSFDIVPEAQANGNETVEYTLTDDADVPTTSIVIAIPSSQDKYLVVEDARMSEHAAEAIAATTAQLYANGYVANTDAAEIYAPTPTSSFDRISVRDSSGQKCADVELPGIDGQIRVTAATAYADAEHSKPVIALAAIGQPKVYEVDPTTLQASLAFELDANIVRVARSDKNDGRIAYKLGDGSTAQVNVDEDGKLKLAAIEPAKTDEVPADAQGWQAIGRTFAVIDADGAPTQAFVKPGSDSVAYRFAPQAIAAPPAK